jgi:hypothetical protein
VITLLRRAFRLLSALFLLILLLLNLRLYSAAADRYALGLLPVGDAFLVWAKNSSPWVTSWSPATDLPPIVQPWWRLPFHLVTLLIAALLWRLDRVARSLTP